MDIRKISVRLPFFFGLVRVEEHVKPAERFLKRLRFLELIRDRLTSMAPKFAYLPIIYLEGNCFSRNIPTEIQQVNT